MYPIFRIIFISAIVASITWTFIESQALSLILTVIIGLFPFIYLAAIYLLVDQLRNIDTVTAERLLIKWKGDAARKELETNLTALFILFCISLLIFSISFISFFLGYASLLLVINSASYTEGYYGSDFEELLKELTNDD